MFSLLLEEETVRFGALAHTVVDLILNGLTGRLECLVEVGLLSDDGRL